VSSNLLLRSQTKSTQVRNITACVRDCIYNIGIIDTPGFFYRGEPEETTLSNDTIESLIINCISRKFTEIHVFAFVLNFCNGVSPEHIELMKSIKRKYPQLRNYFALIFTECEKYDERQRQLRVDEFFNGKDVRISRIQDYFGLGVHFMGSISSRVVASRREHAVVLEMKNVIRMREQFIEFILGREEPYELRDDNSGCSVM
jgi:GTPase Era involved in 16S rRNA processing